MELLFVLAPIYWFPGVGESQLLIVKVLLLGLAAYLTIMPPGYLGRVNIKKGGIVVVFIFALAVDLLAYFAHGYLDFRFVFIFLFAMFGYVYFVKHGSEVFLNKASRAAMIFAAFPLLLVFDYLLYGGVVINPDLGIPAYLTGFHGGRTGWSFVLGVFMAVILARAVSKNTTPLTWLLVGIYSYAIFISGSRGGVLAVLMLLAVFTVFKYGMARGGLIYIAVLLLAGLSIVLSLADGGGIESRVLQSLFAPKELHTAGLTGGRADGFNIALELFSTKPVLGVGEVDLEAHGLGYKSIHNVWLRALAETGLLGFAGIFLVTIYIFVTLQPIKRKNAWVLLIFMAGYIPTIYEPTAIFGNFWSSSMFWFLIGGGLAGNNAAKNILHEGEMTR